MPYAVTWLVSDGLPTTNGDFDDIPSARIHFNDDGAPDGLTVSADGDYYIAAFDYTPATATNSTTPPAISSTLPADDATGVATNSQYQIIWTKTVVFGSSGTFTLYNVTDSAVFETFNVATGAGSNGGTITVSADTVTLTPGAGFAASKVYAMSAVTAGAVEDAVGNGNVAMTQDTMLYNFTTAAVAGPSYGKSIAFSYGIEPIDETATMGPEGGVTNWQRFYSGSADPNIGINGAAGGYFEDQSGTTYPLMSGTLSNAGNFDNLLAVDDGSPFFHVVNSGSKADAATIASFSGVNNFAAKYDVFIFIEANFSSTALIDLTMNGETKNVQLRSGTPQWEGSHVEGQSYVVFRNVTTDTPILTRTQITNIGFCGAIFRERLD